MSININQYLNKTVDFEIGNETISVKLPSADVMEQVATIENTFKSGDTVAYHKTRDAVCATFLSFNTAGRAFTADELKDWPEIAVNGIIKEIMSQKYIMDTDPNLKSQSQTEK